MLVDGPERSGRAGLRWGMRRDLVSLVGLLAAGLVSLASCSDPGGGSGDAGPPDSSIDSPGPDAPPATPFFQMDYAAGAAPIAGWTSTQPDNADHTMTRAAGIGPDGQDGYRLVMDHVGPNGGDNYWGHRRVFTGAPFAYGDRAYFRWRFRWLPNTDCRAYEQMGTGLLAGVYRNKILIVNDASSPMTSRFVLTVECDPSPLGFYWKLQKGGGVDPARTPINTSIAAWVQVQVELQYSSAAGVADGAYRIWIDNNVMTAPTAELTGIVLQADVEPGDVQFGAYFNNGVFSDGHIGWEHTEFQIDDDFDAGWGGF